MYNIHSFHMYPVVPVDYRYRVHVGNKGEKEGMYVHVCLKDSMCLTGSISVKCYMYMQVHVPGRLTLTINTFRKVYTCTRSNWTWPGKERKAGTTKLK